MAANKACKLSDFSAKYFEIFNSPLSQELSVRLERQRHMTEEPGPSNYDSSTYAKLIDEKEKDLQFLSEVGLDLLQQNQDLKDRNEFLQKNLNDTNEVITQLQYDLKNRNSLLQTYEDYEEECYAITESGESIGIVENLKKKVNQLENDNEKLRNESTKLRQKVTDVEEFSKYNIEQSMKQLNDANHRILKLQVLLNENNSERLALSDEIKRLFADLNTTKQHEKTLSRTNDELTVILNEALKKHEGLKRDFSELQNSYVEVKNSLVEAEEELRGYRINAKPIRSVSMDSVYDSLGSEMEPSDSGFYTTPMLSARNDSCLSAVNDMSFFQGNERLRLFNEPIAEAPSTEMIKEIENYIKFPSKSFQKTIQAYRRSYSADRHRFLRSQEHIKAIPLSEELSTFDFEEHLRSTSHTASVAQNSADLTKINSSPLFQRNGKTYRDTCCSPIRIPSPSPQPSKIEERLTTIDMTMQSSTRYAPSSRLNYLHSNTTSYAPNSSASSCCCSPASLSSDKTISKSNSLDSLINYEGRKMGEPGKPGTRDLDHALRKMKIRQQLEREYRLFCQKRGLSVIRGFFNTEHQEVCDLPANKISPLEHHLRKAAKLERQQVWRRMPVERNSGLSLGIQISPIATGVVQRASTIPNKINSLFVAAIQQAVNSVSTSSDPSQECAHNNNKESLLPPFDHTTSSISHKTLLRHHSIADDSLALNGLSSTYCSSIAQSNESRTILQRGALK